jgi:hypothetical protein
MKLLEVFDVKWYNVLDLCKLLEVTCRKEFTVNQVSMLQLSFQELVTRGNFMLKYIQNL